MTVVKCRAKLSPDCYDGREEREIYPDGARDDGTFNPEDGTVVCDACYIAGGQPGFPNPATRQQVIDHVDQALGLNDKGEDVLGLDQMGHV